MEYLDLDLEISPGKQGLYPVIARGQGSDVHVQMRFPFDPQTLDTTLEHVTQALLQAKRAQRPLLAAQVQEVQTFGQRIFEALLTGELHTRYEQSRALATQQGKGVRLRLRNLAPELAIVPWELLYDPTQHEFVCFLPNTPVVRSPALLQSLPPLKVTPPWLC